jgi:hypothetical protein
MPPINPQTLRSILLIAVVLALYAGRLTKGTAKETPEGLVFGMKPLVLWSRILAVPLYLSVILYPVFVQHHPIPLWVPTIVALALGVALYLLPGTITLTPTGVTQHFWFHADKTIPYREVMAIQSLQAGRITRVLGEDRTVITHHSAHAAAETFRTELARRTNKPITT